MWLSKDIGDSITYAKSVIDMWIQLDERYGRDNGVIFVKYRKKSVTSTKEHAI